MAVTRGVMDTLSAVADLSPQQVSELLGSRADVQLIDVREPEEHAAGRIAGARLIPLGALTAAADSLRQEAPLVFVCRSGARSAMATEAFAGAGYEAFNLEGGLQAWTAAGLPLEPEDGHVA
jgi:rhodanese-related sulfurtransferase